MINLSHSEIVSKYNSKWLGVLSSQTVADNKPELKYIEWLFRHSLSITLRYKFRLSRSMTTFLRFGDNLAPEGGRGFGPSLSGHTFSSVLPSLTKRFPTYLEDKRKVLLPCSLLRESCVVCGQREAVEAHFCTGSLLLEGQPTST